MNAVAGRCEAAALAAATLPLSERIARVLALREAAANGNPQVDGAVLAPLPADAHLRRDFASEVEWRADAAVPYAAIAGTSDPAWAGRRWADLLAHGPRMFDNLTLLTERPGYYLSGPKRPPMHFVSFDGGATFFIHAGGNHRACIGRFLGASESLPGVRTTVCRLTPERERLLAAWRRATAALARARRRHDWLQLDVRGIERIRGAGATVERRAVRIVHARRGGQSAIDTAEAMEALAERLEAGPRRWWRFWP